MRGSKTMFPPASRAPFQQGQGLSVAIRQGVLFSSLPLINMQMQDTE